MPETTPTAITMTDLMKPGYTAVVTGASSGIGRAAACHFAAAGMHVFMVDIDAEELALAQKVVQSLAVLSSAADTQTIQAEIVDVADTVAVDNLAEKVFKEAGKCHILMNNAGVGLGGGPLTDMSVVKRVVEINTYGPMNGCLAFVPKMKATGEPGIIINTGSKQGITMPPGNLTYNMSKAALKCYTEGLEHELFKERLEQSGKLRASLLVPGWVNTSILLKAQKTKAEEKGETYDVSQAFFHEEKPQPGAWMPAQVINYMVQELDKGVFYIICPDNDVDCETDNLRMTWTMQDITERRAPLSRWHPEYKEKFNEFVAASKKEASK
jgi:NAD(P)-dependent dehydrogenase (short-subunit alcohol dehydrogenase family)